MFPVWALNILLLKYTLGFPIRNITSSEFDDLNLNLTNSEFKDLNLNLTNSEFKDLNLNLTNSEFDDLNLNLTNSESDDLNLNSTNRQNKMSLSMRLNQEDMSIHTMMIPENNIHRATSARSCPKWLRGCHMFSCITQELGNRLQVGDETAGDSARDAYGPGKK